MTYTRLWPGATKRWIWKHPKGFWVVTSTPRPSWVTEHDFDDQPLWAWTHKTWREAMVDAAQQQRDQVARAMGLTK
jgi:hypothetical protein